ncbi:RNA-binding protein MEX3B isoform X2 [Syngnathoides biaculeatus]|uniref:RNA-binding protein MEX3B isoform X2 n=1 Tax=Syngnathoides biaculeatus TaxID=300417 RepID=UPI002ADDDF5E|nr:RNA-binding protein MEX3B isoform X2 [Syngnathoides biaculeatus]
MPSSLFADRSVQGDALDEQRALQIALDQLSLLGLSHDDDDDSREPRRKNVNMTECVPVPSSEHVAEIVGRQGCKIKALRAKTNTYIKTPVRGMPENVDRAREEIEAHIAVRTGGLIEVQDVNDFHDNGTDVGFDLNGHPNLWSKPSAGMTPSSVCKTFYKYRNDSSSSLGSASTDSYFGTNSHMADYSPPSPALSYTANSINCNINNNNNISVNTKSNGFVYGNEAISPDCTDLTSDSPPGFEPMPAQPAILWSLYENENNPPLTRGSSSTYTTSIYPDNSNGMLINQRRTNGDGSQCRMSPTLHTGPNQHQMAPRVCSDLSEDLLNFSGYVNSVASLTHSHLACIPCDSSASSSSSSSSTSRKGSRDCSVCFESEVIAALVPCGHNLFCMDCANRICERSEPKCPVCHTSVTQAIRIFS